MLSSTTFSLLASALLATVTTQVSAGGAAGSGAGIIDIDIGVNPGGFFGTQHNPAVGVQKRGVASPNNNRAYNMVQNYQGKNFFSGWDFFYWPDPTNGMVNYLGQNDAFNRGLAYVTDAGTAIMKVDNWSWLPEWSYRDSVRITSKVSFKKGQMLILDAKHMPTGCSTWPAFWTVGANWPNGGEIDIVEGVNNVATNQMTLHTTPGCTVNTPMNAAGSIMSPTCNAYVNFNEGCGIKDPNKKAYGAGFNAVGGGVYATQWNDDGIAIWFFARNNIPADITNKAPNTAKWGKPRAFFSSASCEMDDFFGDQTIVFDTTLCGDWAGNTYGASGCPGTCSQMVSNPNNYGEAYWEVNYVRVFQ